MTDYLEQLLEEQEQEETEEALGVALGEDSVPPARRLALEYSGDTPEQAAQAEVARLEAGGMDAAFALDTASAAPERRRVEAESEAVLSTAARMGGETESQSPLMLAAQLEEGETTERVFTGLEQGLNGVTAQRRAQAGDGTAGSGRSRLETAVADMPDRLGVAISPQEERSASQVRTDESPAAELQALPLGAAWLYRQLRTGEAAAGYAGRESGSVTVAEQAAAPAGTGLSAAELDRTLERDARRYDGGFTLF